MPKIRTERELKRLQLGGLQWTVNHVYKNSEFYRKRFDEAGIKPKHINVKDISNFTTARICKRYFPLARPFERSSGSCPLNNRKAKSSLLLAERH
jgi:phenylacetate-CoA ligase